MPLKEYIASLSDNPYFGAGAGLVGVGAGMAILRQGLRVSSTIFRRKCLISLELNNKDAAFPWVLEWITAKGPAATQHLSVDTSFELGESGRSRTRFRFLPSPGQHYIFHGGRPVKVERTRESMMNMNLGIPFEIVTLTTFGMDTRFYTKILRDSYQMALEQLESGMMVYTAVGPEWRPMGRPRRKRPLASVVLAQGVLERIVDDVNSFLGSAEWYAERGVPYRRGYLLHGPPGCGKSSFITSLASSLGFGVCMLSLSERTLDDDRLTHLLNIAPLHTLVLLEDIDAAFVSREDHPSLTAAYQGASRVTFSGLLNALDGVGSGESRLLFMTTNHLDRLDPALIRPGRVDIQEYIGHCSDYQLAEMFLKFYPQTPDLAEEFRRNLRAALSGVPASPAMVQGHFLTFKTEPTSAAQDMSSFQKKEKPD